MNKLREKIINILRSNLIDSYFCTRVWSSWSYGTMTEEDFEEVNGSDNIEDIVNELEKELSIPKHETIEQLEERTGETYPDDAPVWSSYRDVAKLSTIEWKLEQWGECKPWEWDSPKPSIVANQHGKPDNVGDTGA